MAQKVLDVAKIKPFLSSNQNVIITKRLASFKSSLLLKNYLQRTQTLQII